MASGEFAHLLAPRLTTSTQFLTRNWAREGRKALNIWIKYVWLRLLYVPNVCLIIVGLEEEGGGKCPRHRSDRLPQNIIWRYSIYWRGPPHPAPVEYCTVSTLTSVWPRSCLPNNIFKWSSGSTIIVRLLPLHSTHHTAHWHFPHLDLTKAVCLPAVSVIWLL